MSAEPTGQERPAPMGVERCRWMSRWRGSRAPWDLRSTTETRPPRLPRREPGTARFGSVGERADEVPAGLVPIDTDKFESLTTLHIKSAVLFADHEALAASTSGGRFKASNGARHEG
jgi:hypothetical protein